MKKFLMYAGILLLNAIMPVAFIVLMFYMFNEVVVKPTSGNKQIQTIQRASEKYLKEQYNKIEQYASEVE